ncbi:MAG: GspH/FimT family pseudopilin [Desulfopila sp.]|nr:GspH/FimT family pseudopilin [Desulfopila sp.]
MGTRGFSLVELNVCCVVLAILCVSAYPVIGRVKQSMVFHQEVHELYGSLQQAKITAIKSNSPVIFNLLPDGYTIFIDDGYGGGVRGDWEKQAGEKILLRHKYSSEVKMTATTFSNNRGGFNPRPGTKAGRIILENSTGKRQEIVLSSIGRIRTEKL